MGFLAQANATVYSGHVHSDLSTNTPVFGFKIVADISSLIRSGLSLLIIHVSMVRNSQVERIFKISNGQNQKLIEISNGITGINDQPELTLIDNTYLVYEDFIIYGNAPLEDLPLPTILDFDLSVFITGDQQSNVIIGPSALGRVTLSYHGICSETVNSMGASSFTCECFPGYTDAVCNTDIDECETDMCQNGACIDLVNNFECQCNPGWNGTLCDVDLDFCQDDSCLNGGTCIEGPGTITSCNCTDGFNGSTCGIDLPFCQLDTCLN